VVKGIVVTTATAAVLAYAGVLAGAYAQGGASRAECMLHIAWTCAPAAYTFLEESLTMVGLAVGALVGWRISGGRHWDR
jgi:hypothetical protein